LFQPAFEFPDEWMAVTAASVVPGTPASGVVPVLPACQMQLPPPYQAAGLHEAISVDKSEYGTPPLTFTTPSQTGVLLHH
jgi:hypothetical protein